MSDKQKKAWFVCDPDSGSYKEYSSQKAAEEALIDLVDEGHDPTELWVIYGVPCKFKTTVEIVDAKD